MGSERTRMGSHDDDGCLDPDDVVAFLHARLDPASLRTLEHHVSGCTECRELLSALARDEAAPTGAMPGASGEHGEDIALACTVPWAEPHPDLPQGARVGRYIVATKLGAGAMGVVYAAHDPELDRRIALKILRPGRFVGGEREFVRDRLRIEAQAMAQLAHPNVVTVHDVGSVDDQIFIAMELVDGQTLASWLAAAPRDWRAVVAAFLAAGRGLAAAHTAGMVHRDFKPENVLVGHDGRVRVGDFGLARMLGTEASDRSDERPGADRAGGSENLTGSLVGTPYYMAPERFLCRAADARSDQFSFCVALYAAIARQHPFAGTDVEGVVEAVAEGRLRRPPARSVLPRTLLRVLRRGLATDPADRYPSMDTLLEALGREQGKRGSELALAAVLVAAAAGIGGVVIGGRGDAGHEPRNTGVAATSSVTPDTVAVDAGVREGQARPPGAAAPPRPPPPGHAQSSTPPPQAETVTDSWYLQGENAYARGDFETAAELFKQGFLQEPSEFKRKAYLFNVGQAYRQMKDCGRAVAFFHRFLTVMDPDRVSAPQRQRLQTFVDEVAEACVREQTSPDQKPAIRPAAPPLN
jgi:hypothetical protein